MFVVDSSGRRSDVSKPKHVFVSALNTSPLAGLIARRMAGLVFRKTVWAAYRCRYMEVT